MKKLTAIIISIISVFTFMIIPTSAAASETAAKAGIVTTESNRLIVRESATSKSKTIYAIPKGGYITLISKSGDWWRVEYLKGQYGYCHADYITVADSQTAIVSTEKGSLNIRSGAGTSYKSIGVAEKGRRLTVLDSNNGWSKILYNGSKIGYVSSAYLKSEYNFGAISLNVPLYQQKDSRWAGVKIGTSGKTIAQICCATTAIAMLESYRAGTSIYPDAMSKKLKYTASGNVYWPSDYQVAYTSNNYLAKIYELLKQGKPVMFGSKNSSGGQHWVVITGYKASDTLSASNFIINDPGTTTKTNLQQHLNTHPVFYKFLYY